MVSLTVFLSFVGVACAVCNDVPVVNCTGFVPGRSYRILNKASNSYIGYGFHNKSHSTCRMQSKDTAPNHTQGWTVDIFDGAYKIRRNDFTQYIMMAVNGLPESGRPTISRPHEDSYFVKNYISNTGDDDWCNISPGHVTGLNLEVGRQNSDVYQYIADNTTDNQKWKFILEDCPYPAPRDCATFARVKARRAVTNLIEERSAASVEECGEACLTIGCVSISYPVNGGTECRISAAYPVEAHFEDNSAFNAFYIID